MSERHRENENGEEGGRNTAKTVTAQWNCLLSSPLGRLAVSPSEGWLTPALAGSSASQAGGGSQSVSHSPVCMLLFLEGFGLMMTYNTLLLEVNKLEMTTFSWQQRNKCQLSLPSQLKKKELNAMLHILNLSFQVIHKSLSGLQ